MPSPAPALEVDAAPLASQRGGVAEIDVGLQGVLDETQVQFCRSEETDACSPDWRHQLEAELRGRHATELTFGGASMDSSPSTSIDDDAAGGRASGSKRCAFFFAFLALPIAVRRRAADDLVVEVARPRGVKKGEGVNSNNSDAAARLAIAPGSRWAHLGCLAAETSP